MSEHEEQAALFDWRDAHIDIAPCLELMHSSLNGVPLLGDIRKRSKVINYMKAEGMLPGVPDVFLPFSSRDFHGLYIEMKRSENEEPSEGQDWFLRRASEYGYSCHVAGGARYAVDIVKWYLGIECDCVHCQMV